MFRNGCPDNFRTVYLLNNHHLLLFISNRGFPTSKGFLSSLKYAKYPVLEKGVLAHRDMLFLVLCCSISIQRKSKDDEGEGGGGMGATCLLNPSTSTSSSCEKTNLNHPGSLACSSPGCRNAPASSSFCASANSRCCADSPGSEGR